MHFYSKINIGFLSSENKKNWDYPAQISGGRKTVDGHNIIYYKKRGKKTF